MLNRRSFMKLGSILVPVVAEPTVAYSFLREKKPSISNDITITLDPNAMEMALFHVFGRWRQLYVSCVKTGQGWQVCQVIQVGGVMRLGERRKGVPIRTTINGIVGGPVILEEYV